MKRFLATGLVLLMMSFTIPASLDAVIGALRGGNAAAMAKFFDQTVEISLPESSNSYSKSQAELVLRDFFATHPVKGFEIIHKGEKAGSQYCIGTLQTKTGNYRTTVFMKQKGDGQVLQELRVENR
jgi:hypothetical protein